MTTSLTHGKRVRLEVIDRDRYTRLVGKVTLPAGRDLGEEMVRAGLAWWSEKYAPNEEILEQLQQQAKEARRGLWQDPKPKPP